MKRLTERAGDLVTRVCHHHPEAERMCYGCVKRTQCNAAIFEKLAAYEDTGLEPEDLSSDVNVDYARIVELLKADSEDRLVILPCKVGDTVYIVSRKEIKMCTVDHVHVLANNQIQIRAKYFVTDNIYMLAENFGKTVFLTREEAEAALKEADNG